MEIKNNVIESKKSRVNQNSIQYEQMFNFL